MLKVSTSALQRAVVAVLAVAGAVAALGTALALRHDLNSGRAERLGDAQRHTSEALHARAYYLEDVADMVGVHDDADATEFSRYAHVRGSDEGAVVGVQGLGGSPDGHLQPPRETGPDPILVADDADAKLVDAAHSPAARSSVRAASLHKRAAVSSQNPLAEGAPAFYLAVPVEAHRFSGEVSKAESRSAIVGLIDAQKLVSQADARGVLANLRLNDGPAPLGAIGATPQNVVRSSLSVGGRQWALSVDGG